MFRRLRNSFFSGLLVVIPISITVWIYWALFHVFDDWYRHLARQYGFYASLQSKGYHLPEYGVGFVLTLALILLIGFATQLYVGRKLIDLVDYIFLNLPGISTIYNGIKQVSHTLIGKRERIFEGVGLIEFPRPGIYSLVFLVGPDSAGIGERVGKDLTYVFLAKTPNPTSGFFLLVPKEEIVPLDLSVEEGMKMVISSGMVAPPRAADPAPDEGLS